MKSTRVIDEPPGFEFDPDDPRCYADQMIAARHPTDPDQYDILPCGSRETRMGPAQLVRIHRKDKRPMYWRELWDVFDRVMPGKWAVQAFPPRHAMLDQAHKYFLWVFDEDPIRAELHSG